MQLEIIEANLFFLIILVIIGVIVVFLWKDRRLIKLSFRNLGRRKVRNVLTVAGVCLSISLYVAFNIASDNALASFYNVVELSGGKVDFEITRVDGEAFDEDILEDVLKVEGVKVAAPRIQRYCVINIKSDGNSTAAQVIGIDPRYDNEFGDLFDYNTSEPINSNEVLTGKVAIVSELLMEGITWEEEVDDDEFEIVNATVGDSMEIKYRSGGGDVKKERWKIVSFAEATGKVREVGFGLSVFVPLDRAQKFFPKHKGKIDKIIVQIDPAYKNEWKDVQKRIENLVDKEELTVFAPKQVQLEQSQAGIEGMRTGLFFAGITSLLAMVFLIFNAVNMTIAERKYEIGVLRSIGFKKRHIFRLFLYELIVVGITGSAVGAFAGIGLSRVLYLHLENLLFGQAENLLGTKLEAIPINPAHLQNGLILGIIFTIIGGLYPLLSITGLRIIYALRPEARVTEKPKLKHRVTWIIGGISLFIGGISLFITLLLFPELNVSLGVFIGTIIDGIALLLTGIGVTLIVGGLKRKYLLISAGTILLAVGVIDLVYIASFISSFVLMGGSIIFTASILSGVGGFFNFICRRIPGLKYVSNLASKNIARKPTRSTLTFGIFTICLAMVVTMSAITNSIGAGIINWVDENIEADMYVISQVGASPNLSGNITQNIQGIHWENTSEGMIPGCTIQEMAGARFELWDEDFDSLLMGINSTHYAVVNENAQIIEPNATDTFKLFKRLKNPNENCCIISDKLADELQVKIGQKTPIKIRAVGNKTEFKVIGIMHNDMFGYPQAGYFCLIDIDDFYDFGFDETAHMFTIRLDNRYPNGTKVNPQIVADQIDARWGDEYKLEFTIKEDIKEDINEQVEEIGTFFSIIIYASIIVGLLALVTTMIKIVSERRREIGLLRTIGIKRMKVMQTILSESIFLAFIGLFLGILDGYIMGLAIVEAIGIAGGPAFSVGFVMPWDVIAETTTVAIVIAAIGAMFPAWQAGRIAPAESLRYTG
jgi:ABC-type antimicrobial peptide transport system permease subunit